MFATRRVPFPIAAVDPLEIAAYQAARALGRPMPRTPEERRACLDDFRDPLFVRDAVWASRARLTLQQIGEVPR